MDCCDIFDAYVLTLYLNKMTYINILFSDFSLLEFSSSLQVWSYLLENNKAMILVHWINIQMSEIVKDKNSRYNFFYHEKFVHKLLNVDTKLKKEILVKLDEIFHKWQISKEMLDMVQQSNCYSYTKMCIYDTLSSYGIIVEDEKKNLQTIISRLARTQNIKIIDDIFTESCCTLNKSEFYIELVKFCIKNKLYNVLSVCVEDNDLRSELSEVEDDVRECIELWLLFKSIERASDRQSHVMPVYKTCVQLSKDHIDTYIAMNPHLAIGMILLDDNSKLFDIFSESTHINLKKIKLPKQSHQEQLPHLYNVYKMFRDILKFTDVRDINIYQLLAGYRGLDVAKVFEFQLVNQQLQRNIILDKPDRRSLGSLLSGDIKNTDIHMLNQNALEMPHFANEKLMKRFGYIAKLNHIYYLKQFRPCNASQAFVTQQYQMYNRLQEKAIKNACGEAHALALDGWNDNALTSCAIAFIAMIGCNPVRCRVHTTAAKMIKQYMINIKDMTEENALTEVSEYMSQLSVSSVTGAREILTILEEITIHKINQLKEKEMFTILYESQTMVKFAMLHDLPLPEQLLKEFAQKNLWFNFLLFGDIFRYPLHQMLVLSQRFEKISLAEHLQHIILHKNFDDLIDKPSISKGERKMCRLNSVESVSDITNVLFFFNIKNLRYTLITYSLGSRYQVNLGISGGAHLLIV